MEDSRDPALRDFVILLRRHTLTALTVALFSATGAYLLADYLPPEYQATSTLLLPNTVNNPNELLGSTNVNTPLPDVRAYQIAVRSPELLGQMLEKIGQGGATAEEIEKTSKNVDIATEYNDTASLLFVSVSHREPDQAAEMSNALADSLLAWDRQRANALLADRALSLEAQSAALAARITQESAAGASIAALQQRLEALNLDLAALQAMAGYAPGHLELLTPAVPPIRSASLSPNVAAVLAFLVGLLVVYAIAMIQSSLNDKFRNPSEVSDILSLPILSQFHRRNRRKQVPSEAMGQLRAALTPRLKSGRAYVLLVASAWRDEGASSVAGGLAKSFAQLDLRTLLLDSDFGQPTVGAEFGIIGSSNKLLNSQLLHPTVETDPYVVSDGHARLHLVPSASDTEPLANLLTRSMPILLNRWRTTFDVIIIASAPVLESVDGLPIAPEADGVLLVVDGNFTNRNDALELNTRLLRAGGKPIGVVGVSLGGTLRKTRNRRGKGHRDHPDNRTWTTRYSHASVSNKPLTGLTAEIDEPPIVDLVPSARGRDA